MGKITSISDLVRGVSQKKYQVATFLHTIRSSIQSKRYLSRRVKDKPDLEDSVKDFLLHKTENGHIAYAMVAIYNKYMSGQPRPDMVAEALNGFEQSQDEREVIRVICKYLDVATASSGGGAQGIVYSGQIQAQRDIGFHTKYNFGCSVGTIPELFRALDREGRLIEGFNRSYEELKEFTSNLVKTLTPPRPSNDTGIGRTKHVLRLTIKSAKSKLLESPLVDFEQYSSYLRRVFGNYPLPSGFGVVVTNSRNHRFRDKRKGKMVVYTSDNGQGLHIDDVLVRTTALPPYFPRIQEEDGSFSYDGGFMNNFPIDLASEAGADLVFGTIVTRNPGSSNLLSHSIGRYNISIDYDNPISYKAVEKRVHDTTGHTMEFWERNTGGKFIFLNLDRGEKIDMTDHAVDRRSSDSLVDWGYRKTIDFFKSQFDPNVGHLDYNPLKFKNMLKST